MKEISRDKFFTIRDYPIEFKSVSIEQETKFNMAIVYCVWSAPEYAKLLYLSLLSQYKFTDAANIDIKIFMDEICEQDVRKWTEPFPVELVYGTYGFNKYSVTTHKALENYDQIIIVDADTFMFGQKQNLYAKLSEKLTQSENIYMMKDRDPPAYTKNIFFTRMEDLTRPKQTDRKRYMTFFANALGIKRKKLRSLLANQWFLSCFMAFRREQYDGERWHKYVTKCESIKTWCDETVFLTFGWDKGYDFNDISELAKDIEMIPSHHLSQFLKTEQCERILGIVHPLHGTYAWKRDPGLVRELYDKIQG